MLNILKNLYKSHAKGVRAAECGNVLFLILIAVALFAALSYAVTQSSRSGGGNSDGESNLVNSATLTQYPASVRTAIIRMIIGGTDVAQLNFDRPAAFATTCDPAPGPCVFHPDGGGATSATAPPEAMASGNQGDWIFTSDFDITSIGRTTATNISNDIIAFLPSITQSICERLNAELGVPVVTDADSDSVPDAGVAIANIPVAADEMDTGNLGIGSLNIGNRQKFDIAQTMQPPHRNGQGVSQRRQDPIRFENHYSHVSGMKAAAGRQLEGPGVTPRARRNDHAAFVDGAIGPNFEGRRRRLQRRDRAQQIRQFAKAPFQGRGDRRNCTRIQSNAGHQQKPAIIRNAGAHAQYISLLDDGDCTGGVARQTKLKGQHIHRTHRQERDCGEQRTGRSGAQSFDNFVNRTITADSDNNINCVRRSGDLPPMTLMRRRLNMNVIPPVFRQKAKEPLENSGAAATGGGVMDDKNARHAPILQNNAGLTDTKTGAPPNFYLKKRWPSPQRRRGPVFSPDLGKSAAGIWRSLYASPAPRKHRWC